MVGFLHGVGMVACLLNLSWLVRNSFMGKRTVGKSYLEKVEMIHLLGLIIKFVSIKELSMLHLHGTRQNDTSFEPGRAQLFGICRKDNPIGTKSLYLKPEKSNTY